jgi:hypothetical protein
VICGIIDLHAAVGTFRDVPGLQARNNPRSGEGLHGI